MWSFTSHSGVLFVFSTRPCLTRLDATCKPVYRQGVWRGLLRLATVTLTNQLRQPQLQVTIMNVSREAVPSAKMRHEYSR